MCNLTYMWNINNNNKKKTHIETEWIVGCQGWREVWKVGEIGESCQRVHLPIIR